MPSVASGLKFVKMQGVGNDFVVLDALFQPLAPDFDFRAAAIELCSRRWSVGGDGLLLLDKPDEAAQNAGAAVRMRMWNPDGSEDMCGNGLRCIAMLARLRGYVGKSFDVQTFAGLRRAVTYSNGHARVSMGQPSFELRDIPMAPPPGVLPNDRPIEYELPVGGVVLPHVTSLSTGSTHTVIFGAHPSEAEFQRLSPLIETHPWFPERTSIMWANVVDRQTIELRIWERGAGETLACGTGACAAAVAARATGRCGDEVRVESKGGLLKVEWRPGAEIFMTGAAQVVCEGKIAG